MALPHPYKTNGLQIDTLRSKVTMPSAKEQIAKTLQDQPDDSSHDEILRKLIFVRMIERGLADADPKRTIRHKEMKRRIKTWRS
jgi:hypothetical protein